jgi:hypothetical protein
MVASTTLHRGRPPAARIIDGRVVTSSSSMMRGLVRATYARQRDDRETGNAIGAGDTVLTTDVCVTGSG